jgi:hypothetical protein
MLRILSFILAGVWSVLALGLLQRPLGKEHVFGNNTSNQAPSASEGLVNINVDLVNPARQKAKAGVPYINRWQGKNQRKREISEEDREISAGYRVAEYSFRDINFLSDDKVEGTLQKCP